MDRATVNIPCSVSKEQAKRNFLHEIRLWIDTCLERYHGQPVLHDQHDQGTFVTAWEPYIQVSGDASPLVFMKELRDDIAASNEAGGEWKHGYWKYNEAHHGTEHFELFMGALLRLDPDDKETIRQIDDAAEHFGNWVDGIPAWFDWDTGTYRSMFFGTERIGEGDSCGINIPDHLRCGNVALLGYRATGKKRYLQLAETVYGRWVDAVLQEEALPLAIKANGAIYTLSPENEQAYRSFVGAIPEKFDAPIDRAENILASGGIDSMLALWKITGKDRYLEAAQKLTDVISEAVGDPDAGAAVATVRAFDQATGGHRYDAKVLRAFAACDPYDFTTLTIERCDRKTKRPSGVGKRRDMSVWYEDEHLRRCGPILLCYVAQLRKDDRLAARVYDLCTAYLMAAQQIYPDGRDHGCSAQSVSAIARGHGREDHVGIVTGVLPYL